MNNSMKNLFYGTMFAGMVILGTQSMQTLANDDVVVAKQEVKENHVTDDLTIQKEDGVENQVNDINDNQKEEVTNTQLNDDSNNQKENTTDNQVNNDSSAQQVNATENQVNNDAVIKKEETKKATFPIDKHDNLVYEVESEKDEDNSYISVDTTFTSKNLNRQLELIANSITEGNKDALLDALSKCYRVDGGTEMGSFNPVKFVNNQFIDAEKIDGSQFDLTKRYDNVLCWAHSAANILWNSGWGSEAVNPITGNKFTSEDDIATYFCTYFVNEEGRTEEAIKWFFNGASTGSFISSKLTNPSSMPRYAEGNKYGYGIDQKGLLNEYNVNNYLKVIDLSNSNLNDISILESLKDNVSIGISINIMSIIGSLESSAGGHTMNVVGIIKDDTQKGLNKYVGILVSNSDSDRVGDGKKTTLPANYEVALNNKKKAVNGYVLYYLYIYRDQKGNKWWELINYDSGNSEIRYHAIIKKIQTLQMKNDESMAKALINNNTETNKSNETNVVTSEQKLNDTNSEQNVNKPSEQNVTSTSAVKDETNKATVQTTSNKSTVQTGVSTSSFAFLTLMVTAFGAIALSFKKLFK